MFLQSSQVFRRLTGIDIQWWECGTKLNEVDQMTISGSANLGVQRISQVMMRLSMRCEWTKFDANEKELFKIYCMSYCKYPDSLQRVSDKLFLTNLLNNKFFLAYSSLHKAFRRPTLFLHFTKFDNQCGKFAEFLLMTACYELSPNDNPWRACGQNDWISLLLIQHVGVGVTAVALRDCWLLMSQKSEGQYRRLSCICWLNFWTPRNFYKNYFQLSLKNKILIQKFN